MPDVNLGVQDLLECVGWGTPARVGWRHRRREKVGLGPIPGTFDLAVHGESNQGPLYLLAALAVLAISLGPLACAAALRVGLE